MTVTATIWIYLKFFTAYRAALLLGTFAALAALYVVIRRVVRAISSNYAIPDTFEWDTTELPIADQRQFGTCAIFAAIGLVECHYWLFRQQKLALSPQEIVDHGPKKSEEDGGYDPGTVLEYIRDNGIGYEVDYPYVPSIKKFLYVPRTQRSEVNLRKIIEMRWCSEDKLKEMLYKHGPLLVGINVGDYLRQYKGGIFDKEVVDSKTPGHAVVLVGYGSENGIDYWKVRNSYTSKWGEEGFMRIARGLGQFEKSPIYTIKIA